MRELRIVGVDADSSVVRCEAPDSGEMFSLPLDDRLRAAARGEEVPTGGPGRTPVTGTLRPREIQDRIRHGASPEDVAADAGVPLSRIEGFAVPVLLERSSAAEMARSAHPVLADGPALDTLGERVEAALDRRGIDPSLARWDAWRDRSGGWVVRTSWPAGLSDDASATWSFVPDSHGGAARALDEEAERVLDPSRAVALRTVATPPPLPPGPPPIRAVPAPSARRPSRPEVAQFGGVPAGGPSVVRPAAVTPAHGSPAHRGATPDAPAHGTPAAGSATGRGPARPAPAGAGEADDDFLRPTPTEPERRTSRRHPTMPSWEDVLLGVRGKDD